MALFFALHTTIGDPIAGREFFNKGAPALAAAMAGGKTPAKCIKTWNPYPYGRKFCLLHMGGREGSGCRESPARCRLLRLGHDRCDAGGRDRLGSDR